MPNIKDNISAQQVKEITDSVIYKAIEQIKTMSIWKVVAVNPNQTVNIECCCLDVVLSAVGDLVMTSPYHGIRKFTTFDPGILVDIPYRVRRNGQFRDMVCPAVGDVGTYTPTYEDMRRWFESGQKVAVPSPLRMTVFHGTGVWEGYVQHDKDTQPDYPVDNQTRIIKSNRITVTVNDPLDGNSQPTGKESVTVAMTGITLTVSADGVITLDAPSATCNVNCSTANLTASASTMIDTPITTFTGNVMVNGMTTIGGTIAVSGAATIGGETNITGKTTVTGALAVTGSATAAEFTNAEGIILGTHKHPGVTPGGGTTGEPVV